tara:strand:- start:916 stop:1611 length:696 start_codon:yes stop_codon:yes gene_type:complete
MFTESSLAVIPARGGSTRLVNKNIHNLGGKPLIRWVVDAVLKSERFDRVVVSTDSEEIYEAVGDCGVARHVRPAKYATTESTVLDAMINLMYEYEELNMKYDIFAYFLPTCPFIEYSHIAKGFDKLKNEECNSVVSMTKMQETVQLACLMNNDYVLPVFDNIEAGLTNSKFIKQYYKPSGAFYMGYWETIMHNKNFFKDKAKGIIIPHRNSIDINTKEDIQLAESLINAAY